MRASTAPIRSASAAGPKVVQDLRADRTVSPVRTREAGRVAATSRCARSAWGRHGGRKQWERSLRRATGRQAWDGLDAHPGQDDASSWARNSTTPGRSRSTPTTCWCSSPRTGPAATAGSGGQGRCSRSRGCPARWRGWRRRGWSNGCPTRRDGRGVLVKMTRAGRAALRSAAVVHIAGIERSSPPGSPIRRRRHWPRCSPGCWTNRPTERPPTRRTGQDAPIASGGIGRGADGRTAGRSPCPGRRARRWCARLSTARSNPASSIAIPSAKVPRRQ